MASWYLTSPEMSILVRSDENGVIILKSDHADAMTELKLLYEDIEGRTITISWSDRDERLKKQNQ